MNVHLSDDEFVSRLRNTAFDAAGSSTLDVDSVLRSSRRKHNVRRAGYATAAGMLLSTAGFGAAGALPGVPGLWDDGPVHVLPSSPAESEGEAVDVEPATTPEPTPSSASPTAIAAKAAQTTEIGPGVRQVTKPVTSFVDDDTVVIDLGLRAWRDGLRFFAEVDVGTEGGKTVWKALRLFAGTDLDLRTRADGGTAGTLLWDGVTNDAMVLRADGGSSLVFGLTSGGGTGAQHLVLDEPLVKGDPSTASFEIAPFDVLGDGAVWLRVAEVRSQVAPRGFVYSAGDSWGASWCRTTWSECSVTYDPVRDVVGRPAGGDLSDLVADLGKVMADGADEPAVAAMEECVATRSGASWTAPSRTTGETLGKVPDGIDAGQWRLCLIDLTEAAFAVQQGLIKLPVPDGSEDSSDPDGSGPTSPDGDSSDPEPSGSSGPIETVTDGVGDLLEGVLGGVGETVDSTLGGSSGG